MSEWPAILNVALLLMLVYREWLNRQTATAITPSANQQQSNNPLSTAELAELYREARSEIDQIRLQWQVERAHLLEQLAAERERNQKTVFELEVLVRVYEERMKAAGIALNIEYHARQRIELYDKIVKSVDLSDLRTMCFLLEVSWDNLEGDTLPEKARSFITELERQDKMTLFLSEATARWTWQTWQPAKQGAAVEPPEPPKAERKRKL